MCTNMPMMSDTDLGTLSTTKNLTSSWVLMLSCRCASVRGSEVDSAKATAMK